MIRNGNVRAVSEPVDITGLGAVSAFGDSIDALRTALLAGETGIAVAESFAAAGCRTILAAEVRGFDPARWVSPMKLRRMDETAGFALAAIQQALTAARYEIQPDGDDRAGVVLGTYSAGGQATDEYLSALFTGGPTGAPALLFSSTVANAAAGVAGLEFKLRGVNATISQKEASGLAAIATAVDVLRAGRVDAVATGGMDAIFRVFFHGHDRFRVMSPSRTADATVAPFDRSRNGFVMGEGAYMLWLERGDGWRARGARRLGTILGTGASSAAVPLNAWPDHPEALIRTMTLALEDAGLTAADVDVVFASANGSRGLDRVEAAALTRLFAGERPVVTSIKGSLGESGASGSAACVAALLCGAVGQVPPIALLDSIDSDAQGLNVARAAVPLPGPIVLVNSFASGGALCSAVMRIAPAR
jgi:3-oxoacyl-[acyl-carrier-protein] synthase II